MSNENKTYEVIVIQITGHGKKLHNCGEKLKGKEIPDLEKRIAGGFVREVSGSGEKGDGETPLNRMNKADLQAKLTEVQGESADLEGTNAVLVKKIEAAQEKRAELLAEYAEKLDSGVAEGYENWNVDALAEAIKIFDEQQDGGNGDGPQE